MGHWEGRENRHYRLRHAAQAGQLVIVRCGLCRKTIHFLATDLITLLPEDRNAFEPPFECSTCKRSDYIKVKLRLPSSGDYGHLPVRRPAGVVTIQKWRTVKLGD